ncbi:HNH endonuclease [Hymenobacter daecheongensis DSM 21074]|uniref:HNH endonuclease n=1 Tax=Hymenobacter daecheongensis DSM 21074 TaxID=1121955 RepID=A0A1M6J290_9BACT|nr:HNH endonuclease [Hymenobacter daecheongensis]SHJ40830.1 HNH endonuclease [Hymenobacter daecheongensis DSM 21074]
MKKQSIKSHLKDYSIYQKRWTTINHAFAAALSAADEYNEQSIEEALKILGQDPSGDLTCVYCDKPAETWDHVSSTVSKGEFSGIGHQIGNLVPCCKACNSSKGSKTWTAYIQSCNLDQATKQQKLIMIARYISQGVVNTREIIDEHCSREVTELSAIKSKIYDLMKKADEISTAVRQRVRENKK